jgi:hypothetical protein
MEVAGRKLARPDAAKAAVDLIEDLIEGRRQKAEGGKQWTV